MRALLAMPAYNEEAYLPTVLGSVRRYIDDVLVMDDGSTDATPDIIARYPGIRTIRHETNLGYGQSLIDAFAFAVEADYDWVLTMDCDEQHAPEHIPEFLDAARQDDADVVSGSRFLTELDGDDTAPPHRRAINKAITEVLYCQLELELTDAFCGFKAYRVSALKRLNITEPGYAMPLQLWVQAVRAGLRIREIPVRLIYNDPNRHFGGLLDDDYVRLMHYISTIRKEMGGFSCDCFDEGTTCQKVEIATAPPRCYCKRPC